MPAAATRSGPGTALAVAMLALSGGTALANGDVKDFSPAERALFMSDQLTKLHPPLTLHYRFRKSGSLESGFTDTASITLRAQANGGCCDAAGEFLSGERRVTLPPVEHASSNPVTLYFLERDVREMQRLTKGQSTYFRKRIRMAVYQGATLRDVTVAYLGKTVAGREITISPYLDDPNRPRFDKLANKQYVFTMSDAVPGGVYAIRTLISDASKGAEAPPLLAEELLIDGAATKPSR